MAVAALVWRKDFCLGLPGLQHLINVPGLLTRMYGPASGARTQLARVAADCTRL